MKFNYYPETDSLYIDLSEKNSVDSREIGNGVIVDFDVEGNIVGIDIDHASTIVNFRTLEAQSLPLGKISVVQQ